MPISSDWSSMWKTILKLTDYDGTEDINFLEGLISGILEVVFSWTTTLASSMTQTLLQVQVAALIYGFGLSMVSYHI